MELQLILIITIQTLIIKHLDHHQLQEDTDNQEDHLVFVLLEVQEVQEDLKFVEDQLFLVQLVQVVQVQSCVIQQFLLHTV
jgi:hypothetical protein